MVQDYLTPAVIIAFAGLAAAIFFNSLKEKRERRREREDQEEKRIKEKQHEEEQMKAQREVFANEVKTTVQNQANDLKEKLDDKLDVIRVTTSSLEKNFEEFKTVNRDEVLSIKREIERLKEETDRLANQVQENKLNKIEVETRIASMLSQIENLKQRVDTMETRISNHEGLSSTRK